MKSSSFFDSLFDRHRQLLADIAQIQNSGKAFLETCETVLETINEVIIQVKTDVVEMTFDSVDEEIYFFKHIKPLFTSEWIYYSELLLLESKKPVGGCKALKVMYEDALEKIISHSQRHQEVFVYYRRESFHLDAKYFVRHVSDLKISCGSMTHDFDARFSTAADYLIARFLAHQKLETYITLKLTQIENPNAVFEVPKSNLHWTASKASLVELIYGLHTTRCFNDGHIELVEIIRSFEKLCGMDLENFHKVLTEVKARKMNRTKFLQSLHETLERHFDDGDAHHPSL